MRHRFDPQSGRSSGGGNGNPLQYSCLENPMDKGVWQAIVHRVTQSQTRLKGLSKHHENYTKKASNGQTFQEPKWYLKVLNERRNSEHVVQFSSVQSVESLSCVQLFVTPWITAHQASLSITNSQSSLRLTAIELVMPSSHLILCRPLLLLPPIPPRVRVFSNESTLRMR